MSIQARIMSSKREEPNTALKKEEPNELQIKKESSIKIEEEEEEEKDEEDNYKSNEELKLVLITFLKQVWNVLKRSMDIALFALSFSVVNDNCLNSSLSTAYSIYVYLISLVFMLSSLSQYIVHIQNKLKRHKYCVKTLFKDAILLAKKTTKKISCKRCKKNVNDKPGQIKKDINKKE